MNPNTFLVGVFLEGAGDEVSFPESLFRSVKIIFIFSTTSYIHTAYITVKSTAQRYSKIAPVNTCIDTTKWCAMTSCFQMAVLSSYASIKPSTRNGFLLSVSHIRLAFLTLAMVEASDTKAQTRSIISDSLCGHLCKHRR